MFQIQSGGRDGSRSGTPVAMNLEGRVMFSNQSSLPLPSIVNSSSSYPPISSPSPQIGHSIFAGSKYLPSGTPPEAHSRYVSDGYRISPSEPVPDDLRFGVESHRVISSELYKQTSQQLLHQQLVDQNRTISDVRRIREDQGQVPEYHRSAEDLYQNNNPIDLQQRASSNGTQQMNSAQKLGSEILRIHEESQRQIDEMRAEQQLLRIESSVTAPSSVISGISVSPVNNSPINYRQVMNSTHHRFAADDQLSPRVSHESSFRTHTDSQRHAQESFREFLTTSQRHYIDDLRPGPTEYQRASNTNSENMRYLPGMNIQSPRNIMTGNNRLGDEELPPSHAALPENLRVLNTIDGNRPLVAENLRLEENQSVIQDNMRLETDTPQSMVPENLCLTETSHTQVLPENLQSRQEPAGRLELTVNNGRIIANSRILNHLPNHSHIPSSESPIAMVRPHYGSINSNNPTTPPHRMIASDSQPLRVQSPHYTENMYRNDIHNNIGTPAPPTPAPSVPPMPDQASTPLPPQYYAYSHSSHTSHSSSFPAYVNENFDDRDNMTLEEKIERGYQDIKPFDQDYPVSVPMMHMPQDNLPPPPSQVPKPAKPPKKAKEPKPPRMPIVHKCNDCLRVFKNSTQLKNHMWRHTGEKPFTCDECGSKFTQQGNLRAHRRIHTGERPYQCTECKACFTQLSTLKTHQKIHSDERPYKCNECDAAFRQIANLKTHQVTHTGERPHKCDQCDKAFTQKSNLKAHKNRVHIGEGIAVPAKRGRKKNLAAIKPFNCHECGAKFTVLSNLKIHAKLHSGNRPFECDHCGAGFAQRSNLKTHIQRMHGKTPGQPRRRIRCDECPAMFRLRRCLKTHKKRRHPIKSLKIKILRESNHHLNSAVVEGGITEEIVEGEEEDCDEDDDGEEGDEEEEEDDDDDEGMEDEDLTSGDVYENVFNDSDSTAVASLESYNHLSKEGLATNDFIQLKKEPLRDSYNPNEIVTVSMIDPIMEPKIEIMHHSSPAPMFSNSNERDQLQQQYVGSAENSHDNSVASPTLDSVSAKMTCIRNVDNIITAPLPTYREEQHGHNNNNNNINIHNHLGSADEISNAYSAEQLLPPSCDFTVRSSHSS